MVFHVVLFYRLESHVSVNLGCVDIDVPQDRLHHSKICATFEEMRGAGVA